MKWGKLMLVIGGAVVITALGLDAADTFNGNQGTMFGQLIATDAGEQSVCPEGMLQMSAPTTFTCVDQYEASVAEDCSVAVVGSDVDTDTVLLERCGADSRSDTMPWIHISRDGAALACAQSGKRLPDADEWYQFSIGTPDGVDDCNILGGQLRTAGSQAACVSAAGVYDAVGNVWEWVTDDVFDGIHNNRQLPNEGYVSAVDAVGVATITTQTEDLAFGSDYLFSESEGAFGIMRGGFYGSREDAGVFAVQASIPTTFTGAAVGFRCVK